MTTAVSLPLATFRDLVYLLAIIGFILALKGLGSPRYARRGNQLGAVAAAAAVAVTFTLPSLRHSGTNLALALVAMALGAVIAVPVARLVKMTAMPQLVAIFNGVGGGAAALISITELLHLHAFGLKPAVYVTAEVLLGVLIGSVSFSGSAIAFIKLQELITGRPITYPGQQAINARGGRRHRCPDRRGAGDRRPGPRLCPARPGPRARRGAWCCPSAAPTCPS